MKKSEFRIELSFTTSEHSLTRSMTTYYIKAIDQRTAINLALSKLLKEANPFEYLWNTCTELENKRPKYPALYYSMAEPCCELGHNG